MKWVEPSGYNINMGEGQPEYETIPLRKGTTYIERGGVLVPAPCFVAKILIDNKDLCALISNGGALYVQVIGNGWPPMQVRTDDPILDYPDGQG